jgi:ketosteroid isomerase-like protein
VGSNDDLIRLANELAQAVQSRDMEFLEAHLGEEFTLTTGRPGAEVRSRSEWLAVTRDEYIVDSFEFDDLTVQDYGDVALVRSRYSQMGSMGEQNRTGSYLMSDVWVRRDGRWQLVARHITPLADPTR